ncbi:MAG TPA: hypothetical protein VG869_11400 [Acidimicrobiia bacterium]|jgi:hypothetical protein|nr:hypothetical protein [Acidimicrobiia bacterium]
MAQDPAQILDQYIQQLQTLQQSAERSLQDQLSQGIDPNTRYAIEDSGGWTEQSLIDLGRREIAVVKDQLAQARALVGQGSQAITDFFRAHVYDTTWTSQLPAAAPAVETEAEGLVTTLEENPQALVTIPLAVGAARAAAGSTLRTLVAGGIRGAPGGGWGVAAGVLIAALLALGGWAWSNSGSSGGVKTVDPSASTTLTLPTTSTTYPLYQAPPQYTVPPSVPQQGGPTQQGGPAQPGTTPTTQHVIICDPIEPHQPCVPNTS